MIEFYKVKDDPNVVIVREKGARGPTKETRIEFGTPSAEKFARDILKKATRKKAKAK